MALLTPTKRGLYCEAGDFYIDPIQAVERALITHGHSDHARPGSKFYLTSRPGVGIIKERLGQHIPIEGVEFGTRVSRDGVTVSFHPAGHLLGSSQIRIEYKGEVWVVSGDYKTEIDRTCEAFEPVKCHTFITESTFALPVYRWDPQEAVFRDLDAWRARNATEGYSSVVFCYSLGKAQRILGGVAADVTPIVIHNTVEQFLPVYRSEGFTFPQTVSSRFGSEPVLVIAPPSTNRTEWLNRFSPYRTAFASGWMLIRRNRRNRAYDKGIVLSDHADWDGLLRTIEATQAEQILVTHGFTREFVRYLREQGKNAGVIPTHFEKEDLARL